MKKDMNDILHDRPKRGGFRKNDQKGEKKLWQRQQADDTFPKRESTSPRRRDCSKQSEVHLAPLNRFLQSKLGQKWDDVFSEVCQSSTKIFPAWEDARFWSNYLVEKNVILFEDHFFDSKSKQIRKPYFVDPRDGTLCKNSNHYWFNNLNNQRFKKEFLPHYIIMNGRHFRKINDIWYEVFLKNLPKSKPSYNECTVSSYYDVVVKKYLSGYSQFQGIHGKYVYAFDKKQLNKNEIKRYGLRNLNTKSVDRTYLIPSW